MATEGDIAVGGRMHEADIEAFWESHPCGDHIVGGLNERFRGDYERFFTDYD